MASEEDAAQTRQAVLLAAVQTGLASKAALSCCPEVREPGGDHSLPSPSFPPVLHSSSTNFSLLFSSSPQQEIFKALEKTVPADFADNKDVGAKLMARAYVLYWAVRGTKGVPFVCDFLLDGRTESFTAPSLDVFFDDLAKAYEAETGRRGGKPDWGGHNEGPPHLYERGPGAAGFGRFG